MKEWWETCPIIEGSCMFVFKQKLKYIKECVKKWNKESFGNILQEKKRLEQQIEVIKIKAMSEGYLEEMKQEEQSLLQDLIKREQQEEILWKHKSRKIWLEKEIETHAFFINPPFNTDNRTG